MPVYQKVQQAPAKDWGTVTKDGIRTVQRAWLIYRDAWVAFAKIKYASISTDSIRTWLTQKRSAELEAFLRRHQTAAASTQPRSAAAVDDDGEDPMLHRIAVYPGMPDSSLG